LEFARIVDLLLFHDARRRGRNATLFSDRAGDFHGLDSLDDDVSRVADRVGYQYKYYPSPLSNAHCHEIKAALKKTGAINAEQDPEKRLKKWVLVTPDDLTESGRREGGGDVSWFDGLQEELELDFQLQHWGHRALHALFLQTPSLCLFYYAELVHDGATRRRSILAHLEVPGQRATAAPWQGRAPQSSPYRGPGLLDAHPLRGPAGG
jgi:hypothetical protein